MSGWFARNRHRYPADWPAIARAVKDAAGWRCTACGAPHGPPPHVLQVDHIVDNDPANCAEWNLAALCGRCHLRRQAQRPRARSREEAIMRLRARYDREAIQLPFPQAPLTGPWWPPGQPPAVGGPLV